jgi:hypothetical protein
VGKSTVDPQFCEKIYGILVRIDDPAVSAAAKQMLSKRWGYQRPVRLARELELRASELPDAERVRLLHALTTTDEAPNGDAA